MRASILPGDPGYPTYMSLLENNTNLKVYVDDVLQPAVVTVDTEAGFVEVFGDPAYIYSDDGNEEPEINKVQVFGTVRVEEVCADDL